jgi:hypothetical protein
LSQSFSFNFSFHESINQIFENQLGFEAEIMDASIWGIVVGTSLIKKGSIFRALRRNNFNKFSISDESVIVGISSLENQV